MTTKNFLERLAGFIQELIRFYGELSEELPNLRVVVDNTRDFSELKKMPRRYFLSLGKRSKANSTNEILKILQKV